MRGKTPREPARPFISSLRCTNSCSKLRGCLIEIHQFLSDADGSPPVNTRPSALRTSRPLWNARARNEGWVQAHANFRRFANDHWCRLGPIWHDGSFCQSRRLRSEFEVTKRKMLFCRLPVKANLSYSRITLRTYWQWRRSRRARGAIAPNKNIPGREYLCAPSKF